MAVLAKMVCTERIEKSGARFPVEHFEEDHWFTSMERGEGQKCNCVRISNGVAQVTVKLKPVYDTTPGHENHRFWDATPSGELSMTISNPSAFNQIEAGVEYFVEIRRARS